ncbi:unnamed protein product [Didymodactylos carnosus]|uniref:Uncharacterized protein n=1 Tax=Didymodactylos carnosus TaxID=1234261 RepID=A0A814CFF3_9BILA|nr:unnamed protein product [Didymodactylos carnosus]CAF3716098.1 unnamed protein product [Didymodactylos carnosus]
MSKYQPRVSVISTQINLSVETPEQTSPNEVPFQQEKTKQFGRKPFYGSMQMFSLVPPESAHRVARQHQSFTTPGPTNRGCCYFFGQKSTVTSMSQMLNVSTYASAIDTYNVIYNLSAWMGGWANQNDSAIVRFQFLSSTFTLLGTSIQIGPVLDTDRSGKTQLMYRSATGMLLLHILRQMPRNNQALRDMIEKCSDYYRTNKLELNKIEQF